MMEATWLAVVISVPLYLNIWGDSIQAEKDYLLRSFALILLAAWVAKLFCLAGLRIESHGREKAFGSSVHEMPLIIPIIALASVWLLSTALGLSPWLSFWGVWFRRDRICTSLSCLLFFAARARNP